MADYTYEDITQWKIIPIESITLYLDVEASSVSVEFGVFEDGSYWNLKPILGLDDLGAEKVLAYAFDAEFICIQDNYGDMKDNINRINTLLSREFSMRLSALSGQPAGETMFFNTVESGTSVLDVKSWNFIAKEWNQNKESPKMTIGVTGILSSEIFSVAGYDIFKQQWS